MKKVIIFALFIAGQLFSLNVQKKFDIQQLKNSDIKKLTAELKVENLTLNYISHFRKDRINLIKKYGDFYFGCQFGRYGNGGWNIWNFLSVSGIKNGENFDAIKKYPLEKIYVLENTEKRAICELLFPTARDGKNHISLKILKYKDIKNWFFMKIAIEDKNFHPSTIYLSSYPGNTSGPPERERWCASQSNRYNLHKGKAVLSKEDYSLMLFNKFDKIQKKYGCLLVWIPEDFEKVEVAGTYGVGIRLYPLISLTES